MTTYVARVVGRRKGVHRLVDDPQASGSCHVGPWSSEYLTAEQFAAIVMEEPRRLCGHEYPVRDKPKPPDVETPGDEVPG
jgi:hypothetical protein